MTADDEAERARVAEVHQRLTLRLAAVLAAVHDVGQVTSRLCEAGRLMLDADGAALTLATSADAPATMVAATDVLSIQLEDLQDALGEGPGRQAMRDGASQVADLGATDDVRWPLMHEHARSLGFSGTVLVVPLRPAGTVIGALMAHRSSGTVLEAHDAMSADFLSVALGTALLHDSAPAGQDEVSGEVWASHAEVHQATGMVISQVGVRPEDALALMRGQAFATGRNLDDVATDVIERRVNFRDFTIEGGRRRP